MKVFADNTERFVAFWEARNYEQIALGLPELLYWDARAAYERFTWAEQMRVFGLTLLVA